MDAFNVPADREKMLVVLCRKGFETSLLELPWSSRLAMSMPALNPQSSSVVPLRNSVLR